MKIVHSVFHALVGFLLVFLVHIPKIVWSLLHLSYAAVFNKHENLTADPKEHLRRALRLLRKDNSHLLYAALEIRLALERMTDLEVEMASQAARRVLKINDPVKKTNYLRILNEATRYPHKVLVVNPKTGEKFDFGDYKPLDSDKVREIEGKIGNLLHIQHGILYGVHDCPWYRETRQFLRESARYLLDRHEANTPFFMFENAKHIEMVRSDALSVTGSVE